MIHVTVFNLLLRHAGVEFAALNGSAQNKSVRKALHGKKVHCSKFILEQWNFFVSDSCGERCTPPRGGAGDFLPPRWHPVVQIKSLCRHKRRQRVTICAA